MKKIIVLLICYCFITTSSKTQGITALWQIGYGSYWGAPYGHTILNFQTGNLVITSDSIEMDINRTSANIADNSGNLLFYTNGYYIADASNDTMTNGNNISPTAFINQFAYGLTVPQACLILPFPDSSNLYWLFHSTLDNAPNFNRSHYLYSSLIDMNLNGGLGAVVNKNNVLIQDTLNSGKITACKHANGVDWWLICQRVNSNTYYKFLVTPGGVFGPYTQNIGSIRTWSAGMAGFSPDGKKYASFHAEYTTVGGLDIFDFDRCSGIFSNPIHIIIPQSSGFSGGMAFSPDSRFLYTANIEIVYQFDMNASNIASSQTTVATWDGFYSPSPPFGTYFEMMQLAPDGKIYISTGNSTFHMHVINQPDSLGLACDLVQHSIQFQYFYSNGFPNHPNYFLGCDTTSSCTCLTTGINSPQSSELLQVKSYPNPTTGIFTLQFNVQDAPGELEIYDVLGKQVLNDYISPWSQFKQVDITALPSGIYFVKMKWRGGEVGVKVVKE